MGSTAPAGSGKLKLASLQHRAAPTLAEPQRRCAAEKAQCLATEQRERQQGCSSYALGRAVSTAATQQQQTVSTATRVEHGHAAAATAGSSHDLAASRVATTTTGAIGYAQQSARTASAQPKQAELQHDIHRDLSSSALAQPHTAADRETTTQRPAYTRGAWSTNPGNVSLNAGAPSTANASGGTGVANRPSCRRDLGVIISAEHGVAEYIDHLSNLRFITLLRLHRERRKKRSAKTAHLES